MASADDKNVIEVHVEGNEFVDIQLRPLPPAADILSVLTSETDLKYFVRLAILYYKQHRPDEYDQFLAECANRRADREQTRQALLLVQAIDAINKSTDVAVPDALRRRLLADAEAKVKEAERIDGAYLPLWLVRGTLFLEQDAFDKAEVQFQFVLNKTRDNVPALYGMAMAFTRRSEWKKGLRFWQRTLRIISSDPNVPLTLQTTVRMAIGVCFARLGLVQEARTAYLRVLDLDPAHATAHAYLSSLCLNEMRTPDCPNSERRELQAMGINFAQKAYRAMKDKGETNALVLTRMVDLLFLEGRYDDVPVLIERAMTATRDPLLLAELHYYHGRHFHRLGDYDRAHDHYTKALSYQPDMVLVRFPLAQIHSHRSENSQAIEHLDQIREKVRPRTKTRQMLDAAGKAFATGPGTSLGDDYDTLKLLGFLHARLAESPVLTSATMPTREYQEARERQRQLYSRAEELFKLLMTFQSADPDESGSRDIHAMVMYARLLERSPTATMDHFGWALQLYKSAEALLVRDQGENAVPHELLNNMGVLNQVLHKHKLPEDLASKKDHGDRLELAEKLYALAYQRVRESTTLPAETKDAHETTLRYNTARLKELQGNEHDAEILYQRILRQHPAYVDAQLRLGVIAQQRGHLEEAAKHFQQALDVAPTSVDAHILLGVLQLTQNQTRAARRLFGKVLTDIDKFDIVSLLQLGNIWLLGPKPDLETRDRNLTEAYKLFDKVLQLDPRNPWAANGLAIAMREKGWADEALRTFEQVRESDDNVACFAVNYAHMLAEVGQYKRAIPLYEKALERFFEGKNVDLLMSAAKAYYMLGKNTKSAEMHLAALKLLQRALHIFPKDFLLWFNLAIVLQDHTSVLSTERLDKVTVEQMRAAVALAELAIRNLNWLAKRETQQYDQAIAAQRAAHIKNLKERLEKRIEELIFTQEDRKKRLDDMIRRKEADERQARLAEEMQLREQSQQMESVLRNYERVNARIQEDMHEWDSIRARALAPPPKSSRGSRRGGDGEGGSSSARGRGGNRGRDDGDGFLVNDSEYEGDGGASGASESEPSDLEGDDGEDGGARRGKKAGKARKRSTRPSKSGSVSGDDGAGAGGNGARSAKRRKLKKRGDRAGASQPLSREFIEDSDQELAEAEGE
ncbi:hypothetical protein AMAG_01602 [Allomyces macrogynus ATCC 38327]|uniref:RNA polymerase-associated protein CTR9 n=1 Tax=Allomyces macrogynus (strain ATCC 38327) TaxID=578462 RepID=A0A0L0RZZ6_ALLM3|nr:hypothetical protein AMAG_01602 [Allomyces macrogynus ATCC 38327]|eukprot:KNE55725.1 hypothetical protein AMAG_01602 [Allomyces macrogynus ATCC 38327]